MGINVSDLPPQYQAQAMQKYMAQQAKRSALAAEQNQKKAKYHNEPTERVTASGNVLHFASQKEARRYDFLILRLQAGEIKDLRLQVDFTLQEAYTDPEGKRVRAIRYKADFTYMERDAAEESAAAAHGFDCTAWHKVVEDVKSKVTKTDKYRIKKKLLKERFGIDIAEV